MDKISRSIAPTILLDLEKKIVLISGPRQSGKTTLAKSLGRDFEYLNYDVIEQRRKILRREWDHAPSLLVLDELHKMKKWKQWLKGLYDSENAQKIAVTGSARMDTHRKVGDSLAGRYFQFRLFPLDLKELFAQGWQAPLSSTLDRLLQVGGFPEPFLNGSEAHYRRWRRTHLDVIIRQDLVEAESVKRINDLEALVELMTERVGSTLSYNSLREDLATDDKTIKRWLGALENSYVFFKLTPFSNRVKNTLLRAPKYYFFDIPRAGSSGARLENLVALALYKEVTYRQDVVGDDYSLHFVRNKAGREIDFLVAKNKKPITLIEVKSQDSHPSPHFAWFTTQLKSLNPGIQQVQLVKDNPRPFLSKDGVHIVDLAKYLSTMPF